ncbi:plasmid replication protein RepC [Dinoroseobacter sp. S76]|uniref:plasmid replication protein RepC n=1 Tax=Dinoroseobacter sp. S76 TaxID=3415124 RepID=UPI003C7A4691
MHYTPITSFRRAVEAAQLKPEAPGPTPLPSDKVNKWEVLRELNAARAGFGLSDRDLTVLQALLSFHPGADLAAEAEALVVHPSNKSICERLNGMPCSTMRRHLGHLVEAGLLRRKDSPNGKRYARRYGGEKIAFGFDLAPLVARFGQICALAEEAREAAEAHRRLRESVSLMRRDLAGLVAYGAEQRPDLSLWDRYSDLALLSSRALRRKLSVADLEALALDLTAALDAVRDVLEPSSTEDMSINDTPSEQHYQNSNTDPHDLEPCLEKQRGAVDVQAQADAPVADVDAEIAGDPTESACADNLDTNPLPSVPLGLVLAACPEIRAYAPDPIRHWHEFVRIAETLRPMMGISPSAWQDAKTSMGPEQAAVVLAGMLERTTDIRSPGGYLRHLSDKAQAGQFSCGPMIMSLARKTAA